MRVKGKNNDLSVRVIAGTEVILFGFNVTKTKARNLLGFKLEKKVGDVWVVLNGGRNFENSDLELIQGFMWSDYQVDADTNYMYRCSTIHGTPLEYRTSEAVIINISTENPDIDENGVYFNRGVAGSQAYSRRFEKYQKWYKDDPFEKDLKKIRFNRYLKPEDIPKKEAYKWLSRGLEEALLDFISQAKDSSYAIRACLYELSHRPAAQAFIDALERGVDVKILHHAKDETVYNRYSNKNASTHVRVNGKEEIILKNSEVKKEKKLEKISQTAMRTIGSVGISNYKYLNAYKSLLLPRTNANISHNKFIILLKDGVPLQVWTGSTNLTGGGLFGQSNVGHIIRNKSIAKQYYEYWEAISDDPNKAGKDGIKTWLKKENENLVGQVPKNSTHVIFSPRSDKGMLQWYANRMKEARNSVFLTLAFSIDDSFFNVVKEESEYSTTDAFLRYIMVESKNAQYIKPKYPDMHKCPQNMLAYGDKNRYRKGFNETEELVESLTGLNENVNYLHTKYMLIDALTEDPIVISGSANFSKASTINNDENMLIIRGSTRVADIYLTEFMRLFNHFKTRNIENELNNEDYKKFQILHPNDEWTKKYYIKDSQEYRQRLLFS